MNQCKYTKAKKIVEDLLRTVGFSEELFNSLLEYTSVLVSFFFSLELCNSLLHCKKSYACDGKPTLSELFRRAISTVQEMAG